jgi:hypothetical protein
MAWVGLLVMILSEASTLARIEPFWSWNTPIAWTGFILFADGIVWRARGNSWLRSNPGEFVFLATVSIPLWIVFEGFNLFIRNWHYIGLPTNFALRMFGYAWAFATIWPALFEGAELVAVLRGSGRAGRAGWAGQELSDVGDALKGVPRKLPALPAVLSVVAGAVMLAAPFIVSDSLAVYMAAPVWLGFILLLDPINAALGGESLWMDLRGGRRDRLINLSLSGLVCGLLWEFWNYWSRAKWIYSVPIMENLKLFEMPLPGYLGFPAFAIECFTMYIFVRTVLTFDRRVPASGMGRSIAL